MREINGRRMALLKYRRTKKGLIRNMYSHIRSRSIKKGWKIHFSSNELFDWCIKQDVFHEIFHNWEISGFIKNNKPSIDRIDCLKEYEFFNMQIVTFIFNRIKGEKEKLILWGKPIIMIHQNGSQHRFTSIKSCGELTGLRPSNISAVLIGTRRHHKGHRFIYQHRHLITENK